MTTSTHLRQLSTLQPGDSHSESLIEAAIQGHADTREAMRWLVRQLVPATQPAEVTDAERGRFLLEWLKRYGLLQAEFGQMGVGEKPENWWLLHAPWGIDKTRPFFGHGKTPEQAIDAAMLAAAQAQKGGA